MDQKIKDICEKILGEKIEKSVLIKGGLSPRIYYKISTKNHNFVVSQTPDYHKDRFDNFIEIQRFLETNGVRVPKIIGTNKRMQIIVQEDLGDETLQKYVTKNGVRAEKVKQKYFESLRILIKMQSSKSTLPILKKKAYNYKSILTEYKTLIEPYLVDEHWKSFDKLKLNKFYKSMARIVNQEEMVFCHWDFQSSNIMVNQGELAIIDFQNAKLATRFYDLVSLIDDNYITFSKNLKQELKDYYLNGSNLNISKERFNYLYDLVLFQRKLHDAAVFTKQYNLKKDMKYKKYLQKCLKICEKLLKDYRY